MFKLNLREKKKTTEIKMRNHKNEGELLNMLKTENQTIKLTTVCFCCAASMLIWHALNAVCVCVCILKSQRSYVRDCAHTV